MDAKLKIDDIVEGLKILRPYVSSIHFTPEEKLMVVLDEIPVKEVSKSLESFGWHSDRFGEIWYY